ncbi:sensor histidine kinase [Streptosporangium roseum]|uniref:histidine kinase n=1 Tax=Streptosporangium roseum (strain ATCC 12428 / DSM 43021 / JCM 3005 / KCTC 9067 / NCIMB 10171 / NRRL 2505 / NI 9100) TaxID=479432 RepID=D2B303_STRRD|nr:sensor histidine kinase [Streptosporangium roseum]ACZ85483.1 Signal transduction histidine kinase-like protein [Streptosporangium roseum DSM 43021]
MIRRALRGGLVPTGGLLLNIATGVAALLLTAVVLTGVALIPVAGLGLAVLARALVAVRSLTRFQRGRAGRTLGRDIAEPYRSPAGPGVRAHLIPCLRDPATWRDLAWLAVHGVTSSVFALAVWAVWSALDVIFYLRPMDTDTSVSIALSLSVVAIVTVALMAVPSFRAGQTRLAHLLLRPGSSPAQRIRELTESRAATVDAQAAELRRIERDLHDGAQARLVSVRMNLGLARSSHDPAQVRELIEEAWESTGQALGDLRDLVRGIHPPVLADRGLAGAIEAAALLCPVPVEVDVDLPERPEAPVESAVYFAASEALANLAKHSDAGRAWVRLRRSGDVLRLTVGDDGRGGADPAAGTGLRGIGRRLSAFDGSLAVSSPSGGPTELTMELPCASSSPKISPSYGTA